MATYAAFKHVELYNVGKTKKRVLRPPGGGTSDIFGSDSGQQTPRTVRNHMQSNIFGSTDNQNAVKNSGDSVRRAQKNIDSYSRLFGEPERPMTPAKNHMKSSIPIGPNASAAGGMTNGSAASSSSSLSTSSNATNGHTRNGKITENGGGGDYQNGVTKTENSETPIEPVTENPQNPDNIPQDKLKCDINNTTLQDLENCDVPQITLQCADNQSTKNFSPLDGTAKAESASYEAKNPRCNRNTEQKLKMINQMTNGSTAYNKKYLNGNGGGIITNGINDSSSSNTTSSLVSPASTTTTTTTASSSTASKYGIINSSKYLSRNPVTGYGIEEPIQRQRRNKRRDGNPVTGEGYKPAGAEINTSVPALNGANQVIIKNRIPPGGYSSGLW